MPVKTFVQRPALLNSVREQLRRKIDGNQGKNTRKVGIWGLGGAGKSQLARSYLQKYGDVEYDATFWIHAGSTAALDENFLRIYESRYDIAPQTLRQAPEVIRLKVLQWLKGSPDQRCIIVFDGADNLDDKDRDFVNLTKYIPSSPNIHVIITSRSANAAALSTFEGVNVGPMEIEEAIELFLKCGNIESARHEDKAVVEAIVGSLGHLGNILRSRPCADA